jgi:hypothetical protein
MTKQRQGDDMTNPRQDDDKRMLVTSLPQSTKGGGSNFLPLNPGPLIETHPMAEAPEAPKGILHIPDSAINDEDLYLYADWRGANFFPSQGFPEFPEVHS